MGILGALGTGVGAYFGGTGGASIGGAIGGGLDSVLAGSASNAMAADEAQRNREFQAEMSNTAYQRAVADMKAAGLNPMLAYQQGGASSPSGSMASFSNPESSTGSVMSGYSAAGMASAQSDVLKSQADLNTANAGQARANTALANEGAKKITAEVEKLKGDTNFETQQDILRQTAWMLQQQGVSYQESGLTQGESRAVMAETVKKIKEETKLIHWDNKAAAALDGIGAVSKELLPAIQVIKAIFMRH